MVVHVGADTLILIHALQADHRIPLHLGDRSRALGYSELAGQTQVLRIVKFLVAKKNDLELQQGPVDLLDDVLAKVVRKLDATDCGAQRTRQRLGLQVHETRQFALRCKQV